MPGPSLECAAVAARRLPRAHGGQSRY